MEQFSRTIRLLQAESIERLSNKKVAVFGLGGVGSYVVEALCRMGVGHFVVIDNDRVDISNINRQLYALHSTIGKYKVDIATDRCKDINPNVHITGYKQFYLPDQGLEYMFSDCDYVVDAIDTVPAKIAIIENCHHLSISCISSMGTGNRLDPTRFTIGNIEKTKMCPIARKIRKELKDKGIRKTKVICSNEKPIKVDSCVPGSVSFVPSSAGIQIAKFVIDELLQK